MDSTAQPQAQQRKPTTFSACSFLERKFLTGSDCLWWNSIPPCRVCMRTALLLVKDWVNFHQINVFFRDQKNTGHYELLIDSLRTIPKPQEIQWCFRFFCPISCSEVMRLQTEKHTLFLYILSYVLLIRIPNTKCRLKLQKQYWKTYCECAWGCLWINDTLKTTKITQTHKQWKPRALKTLLVESNSLHHGLNKTPCFIYHSARVWTKFVAEFAIRWRLVIQLEVPSHY